MEILAFLRHHKLANRLVPEKVEKGDNQTLAYLSNAVSDWLKAQAMPSAVADIQDLFAGNSVPTMSPEQQKAEEKFRKENFDLITWFVISK
jgi:hypothetical protein